MHLKPKPDNMKKIAGAMCVLLLVAMLVGCAGKSHQPAKEDNTYTYPVEIIQDTIRTDINDQSTLYPISEEFLEHFMEKSQDYKGVKLTLKSDFPDEWGVRCIERLPEGKELWMLQSQSREWIYLAITSGYGTQRILDLMPVAVNIAVEKNDVLETEVWQTIRKEDGAFVISKSYEWVKSLSKATKQDYIADPEKYHRTASYVEQFFINEDGRFEQSEEIDSIPDYDAVIFFYNRNEKPSIWDQNIEQMESYCEEHGILYEEVYQNYNMVVVHDFEEEFVVTTDITPFVNNMPCGMVMMRKNEMPKAVNLGSVEYMQMELKRYFKMNKATTAL